MSVCHATVLHITEGSTESACDGERGMNVTASVGNINVTSSRVLHKHMVSSHLNQVVPFVQLLPHYALQ